MKVCVAAGTRPEWIKLAPVIHELQKRKIDFFIMHTGQHYSQNMNDVFFEQLKIPEPLYDLSVSSNNYRTHATQTGEIMVRAEESLLESKPDVVIVEGDTNSVLGVALAASKLGIKIAHVEAGLRSYDRKMPEEINRILVDHMSDYLFAPTIVSSNNLLAEGINHRKVFTSGNTIVDSIRENSKHIKSGRKENKIIITLHRQENVDSKFRLGQFIDTLKLIQMRYPSWDKILVAHPRTLKRLSEFEFKLPKNVRILDAMGYFEFLTLVKTAKIVLTDSGGLQEEACILGTPCVTLRDSTERPESIAVGANQLALDPLTVLASMQKMLKAKSWKNPFGDGHAAKRIVDVLEG